MLPIKLFEKMAILSTQKYSNSRFCTLHSVNFVIVKFVRKTNSRKIGKSNHWKVISELLLDMKFKDNNVMTFSLFNLLERDGKNVQD